MIVFYRLIFLLFLLLVAGRAFAQGQTIDQLTPGGTLTGSELLPMFQSANPATSTTVNAIRGTVTPSSYTPALDQTSCGGGTATASSATGTVSVIPGTKIVTIMFSLFFSTAISGSGSTCMGITLPVTPTMTVPSGNQGAGACLIDFFEGMTLDTGYTSIVGLIGSNDVDLFLYEQGSGKTTANLPQTVITTPSNWGVVAQCWYYRA